jgi:hypothetical protein
MTIKSIHIEVIGNAGRYRTVVVETPTTMGNLRFEIQVDLGYTASALAGSEASPITAKARVQDAVVKALAEVVKHPAFGL